MHEHVLRTFTLVEKHLKRLERYRLLAYGAPTHNVTADAVHGALPMKVYRQIASMQIAMHNFMRSSPVFFCCLGSHGAIRSFLSVGNLSITAHTQLAIGQL